MDWLVLAGVSDARASPPLRGTDIYSRKQLRTRCLRASGCQRERDLLCDLGPATQESRA